MKIEELITHKDIISRSLKDVPHLVYVADIRIVDGEVLLFDRIIASGVEKGTAKLLIKNATINFDGVCLPGPIELVAETLECSNSILKDVRSTQQCAAKASEYAQSIGHENPFIIVWIYTKEKKWVTSSSTCTTPTLLQIMYNDISNTELEDTTDLEL
jgi:hypothetical protein